MTKPVRPVLRVGDIPSTPRYTAAQVKNRLRSMENLRDIRVTGAVWHAGHSELNDNGKDMMRNLHSAISTLQGVYCSAEFGPRLRELVKEYLLKARDP